MALIKCPSCGAEISDAALNCPHCGAPRIQTVPTNNSYVSGNIQNYPHAQPLDTKSNAFGILSVIFAVLYLVFEILVTIYWRCHNLITEYLYYEYYEYDQAIITTNRIVTIILLVGFIFTWYLSYKKEKNQKLRLIGTLIIAIGPIISTIFYIVAIEPIISTILNMLF